MTCEQLIKLLSKFPSKMRVFTRGYEDGYVDPEVRQTSVRLNYYNKNQWYYGPHIDATREVSGSYKVVKGISIG